MLLVFPLRDTTQWKIVEVARGQREHFTIAYVMQRFPLFRSVFVCRFGFSMMTNRSSSNIICICFVFRKRGTAEAISDAEPDRSPFAPRRRTILFFGFSALHGPLARLNFLAHQTTKPTSRREAILRRESSMPGRKLRLVATFVPLQSGFEEISDHRFLARAQHQHTRSTGSFIQNDLSVK